jgi:hypothetical protein
MDADGLFKEEFLEAKKRRQSMKIKKNDSNSSHMFSPKSTVKNKSLLHSSKLGTSPLVE